MTHTTTLASAGTSYTAIGMPRPDGYGAVHGQQPLAPRGAQPAANAGLERERDCEPEPHLARIAARVCHVHDLTISHRGGQAQWG